MRKRIGIFGGAFDPPHKGHIEICRYLLDKNDIDEIWIIPCFKHPFDKKMSSFEDRITMCRFAFAEFKEKTVIKDIEQKLGGVSYTLRTVEYLQKQNPNYRFFFILGSDTAKETETWKDSKKVRSIIQFITIPRGKKSPAPDISSTEIRDCIKGGKKFTDLVSRDVAVYIITHGLYA